MGPDSTYKDGGTMFWPNRPPLATVSGQQYSSLCIKQTVEIHEHRLVISPVGLTFHSPQFPFGLEMLGASSIMVFLLRLNALI